MRVTTLYHFLILHSILLLSWPWPKIKALTKSFIHLTLKAYIYKARCVTTDMRGMTCLPSTSPSFHGLGIYSANKHEDLFTLNERFKKKKDFNSSTIPGEPRAEYVQAAKRTFSNSGGCLADKAIPAGSSHQKKEKMFCNLFTGCSED